MVQLNPKAWRRGLPLVLMLMSGSLWAGQAAAPQEKPTDLVRRVIEKELSVDRNIHYMYRHHKRTPEKSQTRQMIETKDGIIARYIAVNERPLSPEERRKDDERLEKMKNDPSEIRRKQRQQQEDEARVRRIIEALPDGFLYELDGIQPGPQGELVRLKFKPNPEYKPPSREAQVLAGTTGMLWIDRSAERVVKLEATLFRDVNFGWGFLGHLNKGGRIVIEQTPVGNDRWQRSKMEMDLTGKVLLFKTVKIQQVQTVSDFKPVPVNLTFAQGLEYLKKLDQPSGATQAANGK